MQTTNNRYTVGLDLGFAQDFSALAILRTEREADPPPSQTEGPGGIYMRRPEERRQRTPPVHFLEHVERVPLGTAYPDVARTTVAVLKRPELTTTDEQGKKRSPVLVVDQTGVGQPVVQLLRLAGIAPYGVTITGGDKVTHEGREYKVPKRDLISSTQILLQSRRLKFAPAMPFVETLTREFESYQMKIDLSTGHDSYGQWREGQHDDLVLAVALAAWWAETRHGVGRQRLASFVGRI